MKSWILKKFDNDAQNGPLELVNDAAAQKYGYPLSLWTYDENLRSKLSSALYVASKDGHLSAPAEVTFEYADQDLVVRKTFRFDHTYVLNVETSVLYKGAEVFAAPAWPSGFGDESTAASYAAARIDYHNDASTERSGYVFFPNYISRLAVKSISGGNTIKGPFEWAGPGDQYFTAIFIPDDPQTSAMVTLRNSLQVPRDPQKADSKETVNVDAIGAAVGDLRGPTAERMYVGPKELSSLEAVHVPTIKNGDPDLRGTVDFGWWGLIARPLFLWLKWTYKHIVPNWGWAIVIQTLIITVALLPLRITQMKSMLKMQRIAPQIKSIQEKYKKYSLRDPRKAAMNEEISGLYKKEGVNPAGGCLPLLIQFPFLIAYYRMLGVALDLRHAHWLWVSDLSARDPYFHSAHINGREYVRHAAHDAASGHGSGAAKNDDVDDAADDGLPLLQFCCGIESVLCRDQFDFDGATGHHEPNQAGPRDARDDGKAREEKREVGTKQLRAFFMDKVAAANRINEFLQAVVNQGGLHLRYRIVVDPPPISEWEKPEIYVDFSGPDSALLLDRGGELAARAGVAGI